MAIKKIKVGNTEHELQTTIANVTNLQSSLDAKQATVTGAATTITGSNLTANRALVSNSSGKVAVSDVTSTELGYLDGVTSNVQTQLDGKAPTSHTHDFVVGGRNYFTNSKRLNAIDIIGGSTINLKHSECPNGFYLTGDKDESAVIRFCDVITSNGLWTLSWEMRGSQSTPVGFYVDICDSTMTRFTTTGDNTWSKKSLTVNVSNYDDTYNFVDISYPNWAYFYVRNIKLEKGNTPTDWTPALEDTILTSYQYGTSLPTAGTAGRIFFKKV